MATGIDIADYKDGLLFLATAGVVVPIVHRFKISPVIGFLAAGAILGPFGLGRLAHDFTPLHWMTVDNSEAIAGLAEFGVVFLMFVVGLELSLGRLLTMRRLVFGLGLAQVAVSAIVIGGLGAEFGLKAGQALVVGTSLALSSTAIVVDVLSGQKRLPTTTGRATFAVLIAQDLAVVPILFIVETLGQGSDASSSGPLIALTVALSKGIVAILAIVIVGRLLLQPLFRLVAETDNVELFMATTLFVAIGTGVAAASAGLSMALGGFVAGLLLAETEYRRAIEATIEPFKGLLLGVFFFSVGMGFDGMTLVGSPVLIVSMTLGLVLAKALIAAGLARLFGLTWSTAIKAGLLIGPCGEFAFIVLGLAQTGGLLDRATVEPILAVVAISMAAVPAFDYLGRRLAVRVEKIVPPDPATLILPPVDDAVRAIVVGYGRVGQLVARMLERHGLAYIAVDKSAASVALARRKSKPVYFGDCANPVFLKACGIDMATAVIITVDAPQIVDEIVQAIRGMNKEIVIVARARDSNHARHLYEIGVSDAVPETIEASLQLSEAALVGLGVPMGPVIASVHEQRDEIRKSLSKAAVASDYASESSRKGAATQASRKWRG
jgi:CPA2 family monovalent cation:H+ antiporter-2